MRLAFRGFPGFSRFPSIFIYFSLLTLVRLCGKLLEIIMLDIGVGENQGALVGGAVCLYILIDDCQPESQTFAEGRSLNCLGLSHLPMG